MRKPAQQWEIARDCHGYAQDQKNQNYRLRYNIYIMTDLAKTDLTFTSHFASNRGRPYEKWLPGPTRAAERVSADLSGSRSP
jgi:hypothetical protein